MTLKSINKLLKDSFVNLMMLDLEYESLCHNKCVNVLSCHKILLFRLQWTCIIAPLECGGAFAYHAEAPQFSPQFNIKKLPVCMQVSICCATYLCNFIFCLSAS